MVFMYHQQKYSYTGSYVDNEIVFNFNTGSLPVSGSYPTDLISTNTDLGYILESDDEFGITGKFVWRYNAIKDLKKYYFKYTNQMNLIW